MTLRKISLPGALAALTGLAACQPPLSEADEFRRGVPRESTVHVTVPAKSGQALTVDQSQPSEFYALTYGVTSLLNGGAFFVGALVKAVLHYPPTNITGDTATWGPFQGELEPITWKVSITRVAEHRFTYRFEGQPRAQPSAPFLTVLSGTHEAAIDDGGMPMEGFGSGSFTLDWDARQKLPLAKPNEVGKADYTYARLAPGSDATVDAKFRQVRDDKTGKLIDVDYGYLHHAGGGGSMDFTYDAPTAMPPGKWWVRSRWLGTGAGRSDVRAVSADVPGGATVNDCWNTSFASSFRRLSWDPSGGYGNEATDCVFPTAEYSKLP
jgi:hypothetical protein